VTSIAAATAAPVLGEVNYSNPGPVTLDPRTTRYFGDSDLTDYQYELDVTPKTWDSGYIQLLLRHGAAYQYYLLISLDNSSIVLQDTETWGWITNGPIADVAVGQTTHFRIVADGTTIAVYSCPAGDPADETEAFTQALDTDQDAYPVLLDGNAGVYTDSDDASVDITNITVTKIDNGGGSMKTPITSAELTALNAPVAGKYPQGLFKAANTMYSYTQTVAWSPDVAQTFAPDTAYTANITFVPTTNMFTFQGIKDAGISGLPKADGSSITAVQTSVDGDNLVVSVTYAPTGGTVAPFGDGSLIFSDDFDRTTLDTDKWEVADGQPRQGRSVWLADNVSLDGQGNLVINIQCDAADAASWCPGISKTDAQNFVSSGSVDTKQSFNNTYGYYETRFKLDGVRGVWGAFWLYGDSVLGTADQGIDGTENDIIETIFGEQGKSDSAIHWDGYGDAAKAIGIDHDQSVRPNIYDGQFHTYAMDWSPTEYVYYVDDVEVGRFDRTTRDDSGNAPGICQNPLYVILSVEGASWAGPLPAGFVSAQMVVDNVRVYDQPKHIEG